MKTITLTPDQISNLVNLSQRAQAAAMSAEDAADTAIRRAKDARKVADDLAELVRSIVTGAK